jgi:Response regulator receiver domain
MIDQPHKDCALYICRLFAPIVHPALISASIVEKDMNTERAMNTGILCIDDSESRITIRQNCLEAAGFQVINARNENHAVEFLASRRVDVVFLDWRLLHAGTNRLGANIKKVRPQVRIVLICERGTDPAGCREHMDVIIDESEFSAKAHWLIEELQDIHFPFFEEWFDDWKRRRSESRIHGRLSVDPWAISTCC